MQLSSKRTAHSKLSSRKRLAFIIALLVVGTFTSLVPTSFAKACAYGENLIKVPGFGDDYFENPNNPGKLKGYYYKPDDLPPNSPLVVALHGCGQKACDYDNETGWIALAQRYKFALLFPEQQDVNLVLPLAPPGNPAYCFSWWQTSKADPEPRSIMNMIKETVGRLESNPQRIYITGLSGGGAMTVTMLAHYPDCFAGGAPMAGVPFGCADRSYPGLVDPMALATYTGILVGRNCMCIDGKKIQEGTWLATDYKQAHDQCMAEQPETAMTVNDPSGRSADWWGEQVRKMRDNAEVTKWPRISIWHGATDSMVAPINLHRLMLQWTNLHGLDPRTASETVQEPQPDESLYDIQHRRYADASGHVQVETYLIKSKNPTQAPPGTGHVTTIDPETQCGCAYVDCKLSDKLEYIQDANICSSLRVAQFWGLDQSAPPTSGQRCSALRD